MHQSRSPNLVPSLELASFSLPSNEAQPLTVGISSTSHLQQQSIKAASPIKMMPLSVTTKNFEESSSTVAAILPNKEEALLPREESKKGPEIESRWAQHETLALLKIRSEMDIAFQDVTLKGPLWEVVSRKLSELGYNRSAKKCKEKFENIQKYHKRAKEGRAGGQHGKSYYFSGQLEALHNITTISTASTINPIVTPTDINTVSNPAIAIADTSLGLSNTPPFSSGSDDSKVEGSSQKGQKRKREKGSKTSKTMMTFFKELMRQVVERQDAMQQQFLEALEKRERDRMVREEAWRRQEMARLTREKELMAQERAAIASREQAIIAFLHKITGQEGPMAPLSTTTTTTTPTPQPSSPQQQQQQQQSSNDTERTIVLVGGQQEMMTGNTTTESVSSRWPKIEVHALIKLRTNLEPFYQEGVKGPLWEKIAMGMQQLGYNRSAKKCKEKWENINKYFKKVKESNKNRPENSRTCPYFHQLDAFYRSKPLSQIKRILQQPESSPDPNPTLQVSGSTLVTMSPSQLQHAEGGTSDEGGQANNNNGNEENSEADVGCSNNSMTSGKDADKELMDQSHQAMVDDHDKLEEPNDENIDQEDDNKNGDQNVDEEDRKI